MTTLENVNILIIRKLKLSLNVIQCFKTHRIVGPPADVVSTLSLKGGEFYSCMLISIPQNIQHLFGLLVLAKNFSF